ncbi:hypothetical protein [Poriferisphaera sp. WC338]|uniref:hypothetical protein n=1 Tax=Poriferisphaera sp. WC338 TaxID=3425129 RepID=UPI003D813D58
MSEVKHEDAVPIDHVDDQKSMADTGFFKFFEAAVRFESSDLIMRAGQVPKLRLRGSLKNLDVPAIEVKDFEHWVEESLSTGLKNL